MAMENPSHPGLSIKENFLEPLGLSVTDAARVLGVARHTLSRVLNGHAAVSPEMAIRLEKAGWSNADFWLRQQTAYDLIEARRDEDRIEVEHFGHQPVMRQGLGDKGINTELVDWYYGRSGRRFVIIHPEPDSLVENSHGAIRKHWDEWKRNDAISIIEKRFEDVEIAEFEEAVSH